MSHDDREWIRGVPTPLPPGERIQWQGGPTEAGLARHVFHARKIGFYFALLLAWRAADAMAAPAGYFTAGALPLLGFGIAAVACSLVLARLTARTSTYAITDRRVVLRTGIVLTATINIPFRQIESAAVRLRSDGTGDIAVRLSGRDRLAYLLLWPHARAWRISRPEPTLRSVSDAARVGGLLRELVLATGDAAPPVPGAIRPPVPRRRREVEALA